MQGTTNLNTLLGNMEPELQPEEYIFCTFADASAIDFCKLNPIGYFQEKEGHSLIISKESADNSRIAYDTTYKLISLTIHSSLDAVGLTAAISGKLAEHGISANVVAAYYHDHIFVQKEKAGEAMKCIWELQQENRK